jgi:hypothetical protein
MNVLFSSRINKDVSILSSWFVGRYGESLVFTLLNFLIELSRNEAFDFSRLGVLLSKTSFTNFRFVYIL